MTEILSSNCHQNKAFLKIGRNTLVPATGLEPVRCYSLEPESKAKCLFVEETGQWLLSGVFVNIKQHLKQHTAARGRKEAHGNQT
jgi:hypothetical protein